MEKNIEFSGVCSDYTSEGLGVVKTDNLAVFIPKLLIGEEGKFAITRNMKKYAYGRIVELDKTSAARIEPKCSIASLCGGCHLQHMNDLEQDNFKLNQVKNIFQKNNLKEVNVTLNKNEQRFEYRNKAMIPLEYEDGLFGGFYKVNSHQIVRMDNCLIQHEVINKVYLQILEVLNKFHFKAVISHIVLRYSVLENKVLVGLVAKKFLYLHKDEIVAEIAKFELVGSIYTVVNDLKDNVVLKDDNYLEYGAEFLVDIVNSKKFKISITSFYQVNIFETSKLYDHALGLLDLNKDDKLLDAFCGVGTLGVLSADKVNSVYAVDSNKEAISDAIFNAKLNSITNIEFSCRNILKTFRDTTFEFSKVIVDPPRKGLSDDFIASLCKKNPSKIVYISCNPATLARDLGYFKAYGYDLNEVKLFDMFANTYHVESVVLLEKK